MSAGRVSTASGASCSTVPAASEPLRLAGLLPLSDSLAAHWPACGAWTWPIGAACDWARPDSASGPTWRLLRGFSAARRQRHEGADFGDGRGGDGVRAAAHGIVVAGSDGPGGGYGSHVVLAHRLREGGLAYSVYSHLRPGSIRVHAGQPVWAGETLGEVGHSGRATTDHLHFEVHVARDPAVRWEHTRAVDPLVFVEPRLPAHRGDSTWAGPYLEWADRAGLLGPGTLATDGLTAGAWHAMLWRAACLPPLDPPSDPAALRAALIEDDLLPAREPVDPDRMVPWKELSRDLARLEQAGSRLPPGPLEAAAHEAVCRARFGCDHPARDLRAPRGGAAEATAADICVLLADLAGPSAAPAADGERPR